MSSVLLLLSLMSATPGDAWPAFRGDGSSVSLAKQLPTTWSDNQNAAWVIDLPGYGQSSPVVLNKTVFLTAVEGESKEKLLVFALEAASGKILWTKEFMASQKIPSSDYVSRGAPTPVVDADRLYVFFETGDLLALTHKGDLVWQRSLVNDYGKFGGNHGVGSSLAAQGDAVHVLVDHDGPSYLLAVSKATGETQWKVDRESRVSWSSPIVDHSQEVPQVLISSNGALESYLASTGERRWWITGLSGNTVASPTIRGGLVMVGSSKPNENFAVRLDGKGELTPTDIRWRSDEATSSFGSPLLTDDVAYFVSKAGVLYALDSQTGATLWTDRLGDSPWASPLAAEGKVYLFNKGGTTIVYQEGREKKRLAENPLTVDGRIYGVAAVDQAFFVRSGTRLWKLSAPTQPSSSR